MKVRHAGNQHPQLDSTIFMELIQLLTDHNPELRTSALVMYHFAFAQQSLGYVNILELDRVQSRVSVSSILLFSTPRREYGYSGTYAVSGSFDLFPANTIAGIVILIFTIIILTPPSSHPCSNRHSRRNLQPHNKRRLVANILVTIYVV